MRINARIHINTYKYIHKWAYMAQDNNSSSKAEALKVVKKKSNNNMTGNWQSHRCRRRRRRRRRHRRCDSCAFALGPLFLCFILKLVTSQPVLRRIYLCASFCVVCLCECERVLGKPLIVTFFLLLLLLHIRPLLIAAANVKKIKKKQLAWIARSLPLFLSLCSDVCVSSASRFIWACDVTRQWLREL